MLKQKVIFFSFVIAKSVSYLKFGLHWFFFFVSNLIQFLNLVLIFFTSCISVTRNAKLYSLFHIFTYFLFLLYSNVFVCFFKCAILVKQSPKSNTSLIFVYCKNQLYSILPNFELGFNL